MGGAGAAGRARAHHAGGAPAAGAARPGKHCRLLPGVRALCLDRRALRHGAGRQHDGTSHRHRRTATDVADAGRARTGLPHIAGGFGDCAAGRGHTVARPGADPTDGAPLGSPLGRSGRGDPAQHGSQQRRRADRPLRLRHHDRGSLRLCASCQYLTAGGRPLRRRARHAVVFLPARRFGLRLRHLKRILHSSARISRGSVASVRQCLRRDAQHDHPAVRTARDNGCVGPDDIQARLSDAERAFPGRRLLHRAADTVVPLGLRRGRAHHHPVGLRSGTAAPSHGKRSPSCSSPR